jgi:hypothetical protein
MYHRLIVAREDEYVSYCLSDARKEKWLHHYTVVWGENIGSDADVRIHVSGKGVKVSCIALCLREQKAYLVKRVQAIKAYDSTLWITDSEYRTKLLVG